MVQTVQHSYSTPHGYRFLGLQTCVYKKNQNNRGQALIIILVFLPLFALLLSFLNEHLSLLHTKLKTQKICRLQTYKAQKALVDGFEQLIKLNPTANVLRKQKRLALEAVKHAHLPPAKAAATAYLAAVHQAQIAFSLKQKAIIQKAKFLAQIEISKISGHRYFKSPPFSLVPRPLNSLSPSYYKALNFQKKQEILVLWKITNTRHQRQTGQCGSHVKSIGNHFQIKYSYPDTLSLSY